MYNKIIYYPMLKNYFAPDQITLDITSDIKNRKNIEPISVENTKEIFIDPGGMLLIDTKPFTYTFDNLMFSVKPEHILGAIKNWGDYKKNIYNEMEYFIVYPGPYDVLYLTPECHKNVGQWLFSLFGEGQNSTLDLVSRFVKISKAMKNNARK